ncbi:MAG: 3-keto-5-aminohexanoate cleavage protein, partial [Pseudomonadota bacterium]|nr:3-keto-5-aminohexanoate cleavage protein [Pseudomonadota bacterium]
MTEPTSLPPLMVAPNGARLTDDDHPAVPVTIPQIVETARKCAAAGAGAMHFHVRDAAKAHILDPGLNREALAELAVAVPGLHLQMTTETVGRYGPDDMRRLAREVVPPGVSIGVPEMIPSGQPSAEDAAFYHWLADTGIRTQH